MKKLGPTEHRESLLEPTIQPASAGEERLYTESELEIAKELAQTMGLPNLMDMSPQMKSFFGELLKARQSQIHTPATLERLEYAPNGPQRSMQKFQLKRSWDPDDSNG